AEAISKTVDTMFENSPDETKTQTEKDFNLGFVKQIGDIGLIVRWILFAVFFTLLLVVGNTMAQSVRERVPELAVLKTLGFTDGSVLGFVLAEAAALCLFGGLLGLLLATTLGAMVEKGTGGQFALRLDVSVWLIGIAAVVLMSIAVGLLPALRARRLRIVDALAGRLARKRSAFCPRAERAAGHLQQMNQRPAEPKEIIVLSQAFAITGINIRSIPERWGSSLVIVIGLAGVVAVFTALLAMATGFESTLRATGRADAAIIMRGGSNAELNSGLDRGQTDLIEQAPGIRAGADGKPLASAEMMI